MNVRNPYLLPQTVDPIHYEISLKPDLNHFTFSGSETISVEINRPTKKVTLHALDLQILSAQVRAPLAAVPMKAQHIRWDKKKETITLEFSKPLPKGPALLMFEFEGSLNDKLHGFYRTSYFVKRKIRWGAATQFEATDARRAFPCWDEPARKATFSVALTIPESLTALSNMPMVRQSSSERGWKTLWFDKSPRMSTYLLAFVIAELECLESKDHYGVPVRVWTSPGKKIQGRFALEQGCHTLAYFADWFGIPYAFPKLDMVALPDFASGAMENWGLVTYRETALLIDPRNSSAAARQRVAEVVDHELAHQWFGNYTTMQWWTDLWLNEGFASYMGPKATDHRFPEWETWTQYITDDYLAALHEDSLRNTHPVEVSVKNPHEIREVFDAISYSKGSVVNRMVEHYLGEEKFRSGLHRYLTRHAFGNACTNDLWKALEEESGKPVRAIMTGYTQQPGYPILIVKEKQAKGKRTLALEQERFLIGGGKDIKKPLWKIPVGVLIQGAKQPVFEDMIGRRHQFRILADDSQWVKLNPSQSGFYRVAYPEHRWKQLAQTVKADELPTIDRLGLLDDAFAIARAGYLKTSVALDLLKAYPNETDFSVWIAISQVFASLDNLLGRERFHLKFRKMACQFFQTIATRKGWDRKPSDGHLDMLLRAVALRNLGGYGDPATIACAHERFERFCKQGKLDPDLRQTVYSLVAENGGGAEWRKLLKVYHSTDLHEEKLRVLRGAGSFHDVTVLRQVLDFSLSKSVRSQDTPFVLASASTHPVGRTLAWKFLKNNWKTFVERYHGSGIGLLSRVVAISSGFTTDAELKDTTNFFRANRVPGTERAIKKSLETIRSNIAWRKRALKELQIYFA